ncbi:MULTISPECIES: DM13 domain-containing protein [unclassified Nocardioides]|uniref:DM13 domain-containing protein n=1 Tax=unclassified Nocardioides TaxID=2615069 RepID=UPI0007035AE7|nr:MULTISPECIES: DM13 domain-containing protein [unclassified Nocardioides]KRC54787.1 hypothetical protein ASE19_04760 [Nocardioides sp. Root79]KRC73869.1 hypothetical protein ASE20_04460 [Nocardioides sp. Root240]
MRIRNLTSVVLLTAALTLSACGSDDGDTSSTAESSTGATTSPSTGTSADTDTSTDTSTGERTGTFEGLNGKSVAGTVTVTADAVSLAGFSSDEGPDLHVYLTNGTDEAAVSAGKEVDAIAYDEASQSFTLDGIDPGSYTDVVIHCDKAKAVFGAAPLA